MKINKIKDLIQALEPYQEMEVNHVACAIKTSNTVQSEHGKGDTFLIVSGNQGQCLSLCECMARSIAGHKKSKESNTRKGVC